MLQRLEQHALAQAAAGDPQRDAERRRRGIEQDHAGGQQSDALDVQVARARRLRGRPLAEQAERAVERLAVEDGLKGGPFDPRDIVGELESVLLVGHDPDFSMAVHTLTGAQVRMKKGGLAGIEKGELKLLLRPSELAAIAGQH